MLPKVMNTIVLAAGLAVLTGVGAAGAKPASAATAAASPWQETEQSAMRLVAATETTGDAETLRLGLEFKMKPGWKVYWRSPGDAGFPPEPDWSKSRNLKTATLKWPAPERFSVLGLETLGYHDEVVLPLDVARQDPAKPLEMVGTVRYLTCREICIPYTADVALTIPTGPLRPSPFTHLIDRFQANVPGDGRRHGLIIAAAGTLADGADTLLRVAVGAEAPLHAPDIYVEGPQGLAFSKPAVTLGPDARAATLEVKVYGLKEMTDPPAGSLQGRTLTITLVDGNRSAERRLVVGDVPAALSDHQGVPSLVVILLLAVLGGLILNLMPCVLPVLSIKLLGVVGHGGGDNRTVRLSFIFSAAGILFAFGVLAAALIGLKAAGMSIGWGIQFQQPWFLIAMTLVVTAFACNLWGFFEVRLPAYIADWGEHSSHMHGLGGHFLQGALATLLATPCSAPFLGTAIGFALSRGAPRSDSAWRCPIFLSPRFPAWPRGCPGPVAGWWCSGAFSPWPWREPGSGS